MTDEDLLKKFKITCKEKDITASQQLRKMMRDFIKDSNVNKNN